MRKDVQQTLAVGQNSRARAANKANAGAVTALGQHIEVLRKELPGAPANFVNWAAPLPPAGGYQVGDLCPPHIFPATFGQLNRWTLHSQFDRIAAFYNDPDLQRGPNFSVADRRERLRRFLLY